MTGSGEHRAAEHRLKPVDVVRTYHRRNLMRTVLRGSALLLVIIGVTPFLVWFFDAFWRWPDKLDLFASLFENPRSYSDEAGFFLAFLVLAIVIRLLERRLVRWLVPPIKPACPECGYELRKLSTPRCPECGTVLPRVLVASADEHQSAS